MKSKHCVEKAIRNNGLRHKTSARNYAHKDRYFSIKASRTRIEPLELPAIEVSNEISPEQPAFKIIIPADFYTFGKAVYTLREEHCPQFVSVRGWAPERRS